MLYEQLGPARASPCRLRRQRMGMLCAGGILASLWLAYAPARLLAAAEAQPVATAVGPRRPVRDLLAGYGIDQSRLESLVDGRPLHDDERETLHHILFRIPQIAPELVQQWHQRGVSWSEVAQHPPAYRGELFHLSGTATQVAEERPIPEAVERFGFGYFYRVPLQLADAGNPVLVCARTVPEAWTQLRVAPGVINQRCSLYGMFLKVGQPAGAEPQLVFAADRIAWHPDHVDQRLGVDADDVLLGELGMDVGLLSQVQDQKRIGAEERECFYQLLSAVGRLGTAAVPRRTADMSTTQLLQNPQSFRGNLFTIRGSVRRAVRVRVDDPDIQARLAIDHYYQLDMFVPLETPLQLVDPRDQTSSVYTSYPVTVCVRHLPAGMPVGDPIHEEVRVQAFFLKLWAYHSHAPAKLGQSPGGAAKPRSIQLSPLLMGREPQWLGRSRAPNPYPGLLMGTIFAVALAALCWWIWKSGRDNRPVEKKIGSTTVPERFLADPPVD